MNSYADKSCPNDLLFGHRLFSLVIFWNLEKCSFEHAFS